MAVVLDASAAVHVVSGTRPDPRLMALVATEDLFAPHLVDFEVASAIRGLVMGSRIDVTTGSTALEDWLELEVTRVPGSDLLQGIFDLRDNFTVYDAAYVELARWLGVPLVTSDGKLAGAARYGVDVQVFRNDGRTG
jgi:predicted nucleic acid-binding protein